MSCVICTRPSFQSSSGACLIAATDAARLSGRNEIRFLSQVFLPLSRRKIEYLMWQRGTAPLCNNVMHMGDVEVISSTIWVTLIIIIHKVLEKIYLCFRSPTHDQQKYAQQLSKLSLKFYRN